MAHELRMGDDGILRLVLIGDQDEESMAAFRKALVPFLEVATVEKPLPILAQRTGGAGKYTAATRKIFAEMNAYPNVGKVAVVRASRYGRVLIGFILKATGRENVRFFGSEEEALVWLKKGA